MAGNPSLCSRRQLLAAAAIGGIGAVLPRPMLAAAAADGRPRWRIGIYTRPWDRLDYRVALDAIAESGYRYAGLMTTNTAGRKLVIDANVSLSEAQRVGREVTQRGLAVTSVYGGDIPVDQSLQAGVDGMKRLIDNCCATGADSLLMGGIGQPDLYDRYFAAIAECCDHAAQQNLAVTIKPHGGLNATGEQCRKCIESVGHPNFSLWYDPGNIFYYSRGALDPVDDAPDVAGLVRVGMCIKDFQLRRDGERTIPEVMVTPGQGMVDFAAVLRELIRGGFHQGDLVVETVAPGDLPEILAHACQAREYVEQLVHQVAD